MDRKLKLKKIVHFGPKTYRIPTVVVWPLDLGNPYGLNEYIEEVYDAKVAW